MTANAASAPTEATSTPPSSGPAMAPAVRHMPIVALAQVSSSSGTRFGIAALEAGMNGVSASDASVTSTTIASGDSATTSARKPTAAAMSDTIITTRRS